MVMSSGSPVASSPGVGGSERSCFSSATVHGTSSPVLQVHKCGAWTVEGQAVVVAPSTRVNPSPSALISPGYPRVSRRATKRSTAFSSATPSQRGRWGRLRRSLWADGCVAKGEGFRGARRREGSSTLQWLNTAVSFRPSFVVKYCCPEDTMN